MQLRNRRDGADFIFAPPPVAVVDPAVATALRSQVFGPPPEPAKPLRGRGIPPPATPAPYADGSPPAPGAPTPSPGAGGVRMIRRADSSVFVNAGLDSLSTSSSSASKTRATGKRIPSSPSHDSSSIFDSKSPSPSSADPSSSSSSSSTTATAFRRARPRPPPEVAAGAAGTPSIRAVAFVFSDAPPTASAEESAVISRARAAAALNADGGLLAHRLDAPLLKPQKSRTPFTPLSAASAVPGISSEFALLPFPSTDAAQPSLTEDQRAQLALEHAGPIPTSHWAIPGRLLCGGFPSREQVPLLTAAGIDTWVCLLNRDEIKRFHVDYFANLPASARNVIHCPLPDGDSGSDLALHALLSDVLSRLTGAVTPAAVTRSISTISSSSSSSSSAGAAAAAAAGAARANAIYVHCDRRGHARTGVVIACLLGMIHKLSPTAALARHQLLHSLGRTSEAAVESPETLPQRAQVLRVLSRSSPAA